MLINVHLNARVVVGSSPTRSVTFAVICKANGACKLINIYILKHIGSIYIWLKTDYSENQGSVGRKPLPNYSLYNYNKVSGMVGT